MESPLSMFTSSALSSSESLLGAELLLSDLGSSVTLSDFDPVAIRLGVSIVRVYIYTLRKNELLPLYEGETHTP